ncbi:hypothetical protein HYT58_01565 [Candidatus Woesearchaeota archaeon]|nr:hypothetical protein [Candidatus Woesearchaeota archaeon]
MMHPTIIFWSNTVAVLLVFLSFLIIISTRKYTKESLGNAVSGISFGLFLFLITLLINEVNYFSRYFSVYVSAYVPWLPTIIPFLTGNVTLILLTLTAICFLIGGLLIRRNIQ